MTPLGIGIVGARFAADLHAVNYRALRGHRVELAAVCARTREDAEAFARHHGTARVFTDYRALVECSDLEVVDVCATTDVHHEIAIAAARAGRHVIVEKPLTGYFGESTDPPDTMLEVALANADAVLDAVARAVVEVIYAGYLSAATGCRVEVAGR